jgi:hypothetical protein
MVKPSVIMHKAKDIFKNHYIIIFVILFFIASHYYIIKDYEALPSPLYGGDFYFQLGATNHVKYGGNPLDSSSINGSLPAYFVTYSFLSGNIARIFNISAFNAEMVLSYLTLVASLILVYILINKLFKNKYLAAACAIIYNIPIDIILKYTSFAHQLVALILLLAVYNFLEKESYKNAVILGIVYGITGLTHSLFFMSSSIFLGIIFLYYFIAKNKHNIVNGKYKETLLSVSKYAIVIFIGVAIALLWWFKPIFYYHGQTSLHYMDVNQYDFSQFSEQFSAVKDMFSGALINFNSLSSIINSIFIIAGVICLFITKNSPEKKFITVMFVSAILTNLHFFLTYNLFSFQISPAYITSLIVSPVSLLVFAFGVYVLSHQIKNKKFINFSLIVLIVILIMTSISVTKKSGNDTWSSAAKTRLPENLLSLENYLAKNTNVYDTILSTNEISFAINAISGRKLMITRRAQNDPFMDMDRRQIDAAIILYGNDTAKKVELLKEYDIKYLYWDYYWIQLEFQIDNAGNVVNTFDPLLVSRDYKSYTDLDLYGVKYIQQNTWIDPTMRSNRVKTFDVLIISPENYNNFTNPWKSDLNEYLEEVWSYEQSGQKMAVLYKVKT